MTTSNKDRKGGLPDVAEDIATSPGHSGGSLDRKRRRRVEGEISVLARISTHSLSNEAQTPAEPDSPSVGGSWKRQYSAQGLDAATSPSKQLSKTGSAGASSLQASAASLDGSWCSNVLGSKASSQSDIKLDTAEVTSPQRRIPREAAPAFPCSMQPFEVGSGPGFQAAVQHVNAVVQNAAKTKRRQRSFRHGMRAATIEGEPFAESPEAVKDVPESRSGPAEAVRPCMLHCLANNGLVAPITLTNGTGRGSIRVSRMVSFD
ncbi:hypothetical protein WJX72_010434 [[Myrmecia] bisecta]|uniref:Uncharacterized protein n=1 Tax=[Myrmecia] bisecta TaxID=41462 RepID=A0AAW1PQV3_9CHLO